MMTLILGSVGMGKTTLARHYLRSHPKRVIVDPMGEHNGDRIAESLDDFLALFDEPLPNPVTLVYRDREDADDYAPYLFDFLGSLSGWTIFIDEVDRFCSPHSIPRELRNLLNYRRHDGISLIVVARRAAAIHRDVSALASRICLFHTHERTDLDYIRFSVGQEYADKCAKLSFYKYLEAEFPPTPENSENIP